MRTRTLLAGLLLLAGCSSDPGSGGSTSSTSAGSSDGGESVASVLPGKSIASLSLGMTYAEVKASRGAGTELALNHLILERYPDQGLELVLGSPDPNVATDSAVVVAIGAQQGGTLPLVGTPRPGQTRAEIEAALGTSPDVADANVYYPSGVSVVYAGEVAQQVSVYAPYVTEDKAPEMTPLKTTFAGTLPKPDPSAMLAVDMHLHPGFFGRMPGASKAYLIQSTPAFLHAYFPGLLGSALDPYAPYLGIHDQTAYAGASHAVLFAVYTQKTTGFFSNTELEAMLTDPRNVAADGLPWAFGLASINFFDGFTDATGQVDTAVAAQRYAALASCFEKRRDLFIGIKLAHAHQAIAFDDPRYVGVYDVANTFAIPVYLHTGFSPFPSAQTTAPYYDPEGIENTLVNFPSVPFILGHVGQGDAMAVEHALHLAELHPNAYLEISALGHSLLRDVDGNDLPPDPNAPQYLYVLDQIKARGLIDKTLFGSDGPQYAGMVKGYVDTMTEAMKNQGFTDDDVRKVMSGNFLRIFFPT